MNGRRSFRLPPQLATLVAVLTTPGPPAEDGLMRWPTNAEVAAALNKVAGGAVPRHRLPKLIKLRTAFDDAGENSLLIQTNCKRGVRVAVRG